MNLWIRVDANLRGADVVWRAADFLGVSRGQSVGHLVMLWGSVAMHAEGGDISDKSDGQLEDWAGWDGEPGLFAAFIRQHCVSDGRIKHWDDINGPLEDRRKRDRERKARQRSRGQSAGHPQDIPQNSGGVPGVQNRTEQRTTPSSSSPAREEPADSEPGDAQRDAMLARFGGEDAQSVADFIRAIEPPPRRAVWVGVLDAWTQGLDLPPGPPKVSTADIAQGLRDYRAGQESPTYNVRHVRGHVVAARDNRTDPKPANGRGPPRNGGTIAQRTWQNALAAQQMPPLPGDG